MSVINMLIMSVIMSVINLKTANVLLDSGSHQLRRVGQVPLLMGTLVFLTIQCWKLASPRTLTVLTSVKS